MRTICILAGVLVLLFGTGPLLAQPLVPLSDTVDEPLLPPGISDQDVEFFGNLVYLWTEDDGSEVIHVVGGFELHMGRRRLRAREAVAWMTRREFEGRRYNAFEIFLWRDARVIEPAGTATTGPALFATLNSFGKVIVSADRKTHQSSQTMPVYEEAARIRARAAKGMAAGLPEAPSPVTVVELGRAGESEKPVARPLVSYRAQHLAVQQETGRVVVTAIGDVFVSRGDPMGLNTVEIRADAAVLYLLSAGKPGSLPTPDSRERPGPSETDSSLGPLPGPGALPKPDSSTDAVLPSTGQVEAGYLEGDVILSYGDRTIRASQLYFDFQNDRALILDPVAFMPAPTRDVPIYVRADRVRQLSSTEWTAYNARLSTDEFYTPHYHVGAAKIEFEDRTPRSLAGDVTGPRAGRFKISHSTFNIMDIPLLYWPYVQGDLEEDVTPLRRFRTGYSGNFGAEVETQWDLFSLLGLKRPQGMTASLRLDEYTRRGPGAGIDADYEFENSFGLFRGYYINDGGKDTLGPYRDETPPDANRGRATWRHRQYLPDDWQLTLEGSYVSDAGFLEEYFEREFDVGKEQETLVYLKKQRNHWALTALANFHILDFYTETEHLPDVAFRLIGQPLGGAGTLYSENRAGVVRYRFAEQTLWENLHYGRQDSSGSTLRADSRQEIGFPLDVGPLRVVPFGSIRGTTWDDSIESGNLSRVFGTYGLRSSMYFWRVFEEAKSRLFDVTGIRHIIKPDITAWGAHSNRDSREQFLFDETIEGIDDFDGVTVGVRQRWQTRRGEPGRQRTVDLVTLDLEMGVFNDAPNIEYTNGFVSPTRPETSLSRNYVNGQLLWRISDSTVLATEANYDMNDGELDVFNVSLAVERQPRLGYVIGYRFIEESQSNLLGGGVNYQLSEKYTIALRESFDLERGKTEEFTIALIRKLPRWYVGITFELDEIDDDFGISLTAWPEGLPQAALGTRRFTGLATSTGIRPE